MMVLQIRGRNGLPTGQQNTVLSYAYIFFRYSAIGRHGSSGSTPAGPFTHFQEDL
jgi:hypothetical protein